MNTLKKLAGWRETYNKALNIIGYPGEAFAGLMEKKFNPDAYYAGKTPSSPPLRRKKPTVPQYSTRDPVEEIVHTYTEAGYPAPKTVIVPGIQATFQTEAGREAVDKAIAEDELKARMEEYRQMMRGQSDIKPRLPSATVGQLIGELLGRGKEALKAKAYSAKADLGKIYQEKVKPSAESALSAVKGHPVAAGLGAAGTLGGLGVLAALLARRRAQKAMATPLAAKVQPALMEGMAKYGPLARKFGPWLGAGLVAGYLLNRGKSASAPQTFQEWAAGIRSSIEKVGDDGYLRSVFSPLATGFSQAGRAAIKPVQQAYEQKVKPTAKQVGQVLAEQPGLIGGFWKGVGEQGVQTAKRVGQQVGGAVGRGVQAAEHTGQQVRGAVGRGVQAASQAYEQNVKPVTEAAGKTPWGQKLISTGTKVERTAKQVGQGLAEQPGLIGGFWKGVGTEAYRRGSQAAKQISQQVGGAVGRGVQAAEQTGQQVSGAVGSALKNVAQGAKQIGQQVGGAVGSAAGQAVQAGEQVGRQVRGAVGRGVQAASQAYEQNVKPVTEAAGKTPWGQKILKALGKQSSAPQTFQEWAAGVREGLEKVGFGWGDVGRGLSRAGGFIADQGRLIGNYWGNVGRRANDAISNFLYPTSSPTQPQTQVPAQPQANKPSWGERLKTSLLGTPLKSPAREQLKYVDFGN